MSHPHPLEKLVEVITYKGVNFEVVERSDVVWVGCVGYAGNNTDEPNIDVTLKRYREELINVEKLERVNPDWSATLSINYANNNEPSGIMFAQETYSDKQDERYNLLTQPKGLWLRVSVTAEVDNLLFGRNNQGGWEYFGILSEAAKENGYEQNSKVDIGIEYHCHAQYNTPPHTNFNYIPIYR